VHQIEAGDTVYQLAGQYGIAPEAILQANGLDQQEARYLDIGQELLIPGGPAAGGAQAPSVQVMHQVQAGEALITIAQDYGTTVESIVAANGLDGDLIRAGQDLVVPLSPGYSGVTPTQAISGTELLTQTNAPGAAPALVVTGSISPTLPLTQTGSPTQTATAGTPPITTTQAISATEPLTQTAAATTTVPTEPVTGTTESEGAPAPAADPAASEPPPDTTQAEAGPSAELAALEAAMVAAVNAEREANGLPAYRVDETMAAVAQAHADDMVARDYAGHTSPEGKRVRDRLRDAGLDLDRAGENYYVSTRSAEESVAHTLGWFMGDPPHRKNILHGYYARFGVGVALGPQGWYIFVLDFAGD
jgi:uncharacterized protein YkwD